MASMLRLDYESLVRITGKRRKSLQTRWFKEYLGADVPSDEQGPIITQQSYQALLDRKLGLASANGTPKQTGVRPLVHLPGKIASS